MERTKEIYKVTIVGSAVNVLLLVLKFVAGVLGHSSAMVADDGDFVNLFCSFHLK